LVLLFVDSSSSRFIRLLNRLPDQCIPAAAAAAAAVLEALARSLLELRLGTSDSVLIGEDELLARLEDTLLTTDLLGLSALPTLVSSSSSGPHDIDDHMVTSVRFLSGSLTLLRSADPCPPPLSTASLTRLNLIELRPDVFRQPVLSMAATTSQLRELHLIFPSHRMTHVVPVAALPPHLTALFCTDIFLQFDGAATDAQATPRLQAGTAAAAAGGSTSQGVTLWQGLPELHTLELNYRRSVQQGLFVGGHLPDLLQGTPSLKQLVVLTATSDLGSAHDAARLTGCAQALTHLHLCNTCAGSPRPRTRTPR
jgi:hypothetical protein